jgi:hypothetical protein
MLWKGQLFAHTGVHTRERRTAACTAAPRAGAHTKEPKSQRAQEPKSQRAKEPKSQRAKGAPWSLSTKRASAHCAHWPTQAQGSSGRQGQSSSASM